MPRYEYTFQQEFNLALAELRRPKKSAARRLAEQLLDILLRLWIPLVDWLRQWAAVRAVASVVLNLWLGFAALPWSARLAGTLLVGWCIGLALGGLLALLFPSL